MLRKFLRALGDGGGRRGVLFYDFEFGACSEYD